MSLLLQLISAVSVAYVLNLLAFAFYNATLHPLAKFPGSKLRAAFYFPELWHSIRGSSIQATRELHEQYGDVVRLSPDALSFTSPRAWKDIYGFSQERQQIPKDYKRFLVNPTIVNIMSANDTDHARIRKLLSHAFSETALREQEPLMDDHFSRLLHQLRLRIKGPEKGKVDIGKWFNLTTYDVITDLAYGESFDFLQSGEYNPWLQGLFAAFKMLPLTQVGAEFPAVGMLLKLMSQIPSVQKRRRMMFHFSQTKTEKRLDSPTTRKDFMSYILRHNDERGMSRAEIVPTAAVLVNAGGGTTSTALTAAIFNLLRNPVAMKRAQEEVRDAFTIEADISLATLQRLSYLNAVIEETLRVRPPAGGIFARRIRSERGETVDGHFIPANTSLGVHQYSINHSEKCFHNADNFVPERWLQDAPKQYRNDDHAALQPFSLGPRNCLGKNLALFEIKSILARILWAFDVALCDESKDWDKGQDLLLVGGYPPLMVKLTERSS